MRHGTQRDKSFMPYGEFHYNIYADNTWMWYHYETFETPRLVSRSLTCVQWRNNCFWWAKVIGSVPLQAIYYLLLVLYKAQLIYHIFSRLFNDIKTNFEDYWTGYKRYTSILMKISNWYTVRHHVLVHNWTDKQNVLWNVNRCSMVASLWNGTDK